MRDEIEDLWTLAEECRGWCNEERSLAAGRINRVDPLAVANEFKRLADKLDAIAKRLAECPKTAETLSAAMREVDLVPRAEVLRVLRALGDQDADYALYGAADNARAREYGEAAATRACCAIALLPAVPADKLDALAKRLAERERT